MHHHPIIPQIPSQSTVIMPSLLKHSFAFPIKCYSSLRGFFVGAIDVAFESGKKVIVAVDA
jgi:hypothetical protein